MFDFSQIVVTELIDAMTIQSAKCRTFVMDCRRSFALSFCYEGKITYTHGGKEYVSHRGSAVILPKDAAYVLYGNDQGSFPLINFQCLGLPADRFYVIPLANPESYLRDYEQLKSSLLFPRGRAKAMSILYSMFHRFCYEASSVPGALLPAIRYLETDLSDPAISNATLAARCGISEVYFRQLFRERFGTSPRQYILELRLQKARQLLTGSRLPVQEIGEHCGFTNPYHFSRAFHRATGQTPTEYRKINQLLQL